MKKLVILAVFVFLISFSVASDAVIAYAKNNSNSPSIRFWNSSGSGSWGPNLTLSTSGSQVNFAIIKASPDSGKLVIVTQSSDSNLDAYVCMSSCNNSASWQVTNNIGSIASSSERRFDVEFETSSGDAIVVYGVSSLDTTRDLAYKVLPAVNTNFSGITEQYLDDSGHATNVQYTWVRLDRKPSGEELIVTGFDTNNLDINAWVWNGSVWNNQTEISGTSSSNDSENLAVRYAADGSKGMVIGAYSNTGNVTWRYWNGASWSAVGNFDSNGADSDAVEWLNLKADPATDDLQAVIADNDPDLHTAYWNGSTWAVTSNIETNLAQSGFGNLRPVDFEWNPSGSTGRLVWDNGSSSVRDTSQYQRVCSPQCSPPTTAIRIYTASTGGRFITLYRNPTDSDTVNILAASLHSPISNVWNLSSFSFNGTNYTNYGDSVITASGLYEAYESYSIAFFSAPAANVSLIKLSQTALQATPGGIVQFNMTVNNTGAVILNGTITDVLPAGLTFASASPTNTPGPWTFSGLAPGSSLIYHINATVDPGVVDSGTPMVNKTNYVNVTAKPPTGSNVTAESRANVTIYYAEVSVVKAHITPIMPISPGGMVSWQITINNTGETELSSVLVMDTLDSSLVFNSSDTPYGAVSGDGRAINWTIGPILPTGYVVILLNSTASAAGTYYNYVDVVGVPLNGGNVTDSDNAMVGINSSGIGVLKTVSPSAVPFYTNVTYTLSITNNGEVDLVAEVVDTLPVNATYKGTDFTPSSVVGQVITWAGLSLPVGGSIVINYNVSANTSGHSYTNHVNATGMPPNGANVSDNDSATFITYNRTYSPGGDHMGSLSLSLASACDGNVVTVESSGNPLPGAQVVVNGDSAGTTNSSGQVAFQGCDMQGAIVRASKSGYQSQYISVDTLSCAECAAARCSDNSGCSASQECTDGKCTAVACVCGQVLNHQCVQYACCTDSDCAGGEICSGHECVKQYECANDADCLSAEYCDVPAGAAGGSCKDVTGTCGRIANHKFVPYNYECGTEPGCPACPQGELCLQHSCLYGNLTGPDSGFVGENATIGAKEEGKPCAFCDMEIIAPDGTKRYGTTDASGNLILTLDLVGDYSVSLLKNGTALKTMEIESKPAVKPPPSVNPLGIFDNPPLCVAALLALAILAAALWMSRKKKKKYTKGA
jgi:uncharacterized repeat protein (TIGR01451 family)